MDYYTADAQTQPPRPTQSSPPPAPSRSKKDGARSIISTVAILLIAPLIALFLTAFVFQSYQVDGESMEKTLQNNDRLLVWKVPRTWSKITGNPYIPQRGDVIVFNEPSLADFESGQRKQLVKRVVGLPGERVVIKNGAVTIYSKTGQVIQPDKSLPYGSVIKETSGDEDLRVPEGQVYVLGDNRANSLDSRSFGPVPARDIVGKLMVRIWPLGNATSF